MNKLLNLKPNVVEHKKFIAPGEGDILSFTIFIIHVEPKIAVAPGEGGRYLALNYFLDCPILAFD